MNEKTTDRVKKLESEIKRLEQQLAKKDAKLVRLKNNLNEEEKRLSALFLLMDEIILETDYNGKYIYVAPSSTELLAAPIDEIKGKTVYDFFPKKQADIFVDFIRNSIDEKTKKTIEYPVLIDGKTKWFEGRIIPKSKKTSLFIARDITEIKKKNDELRAYNQQLMAANQQLKALEQQLKASNMQLKANEETINRQNKYLKALIETGSNIINIIDENDNFIYITPAHKSIFGYELQERLNRPFYENIHPEDKEAIMNKLLRLKKMPGESINFSCRVKHKNGQYLFIEGEAKNLLHESFINAIVISYNDVTEKKKSEEEVKLLSSIIKTTDQSVVITKTDGTVVYVNEAYLNKSNYKKEEVIGASMFDFTSEQGYDTLVNITIPSLYSKGHWKGEMMVKNKNNTIYHAYLRCSLLKNEADEPEYFVAVFEDITEKKKTEEVLNKFNIAIEQSPSIIVITDTGGNIEYVNPSFTKFTGYKTDEITGKHTRIFKSGTHNKEYYKTLWETITSGKVWKGEIHNRKKNGKLFWEFAVISPVFDHQGKIVNYIKVAQDITERKQNEDIRRVIYNVSNAVISSTNLNEFLDVVQNELSTILDTTNFYVALYDKKSNVFNLPIFADQYDNIKSFPADKTLTGYLIRKKKPLMLYEKDIRDLARKGIIDVVGTVSKIWLGVPLVVEHQVIGAMVVQNYENARKFGKKDKEILEIISHNISLSIEKVRAEQIHKENELRFKALSDATYEAIFMSENGYCIDANDTACRMYGYDYDELIGIFGTDVIAPESKELVKKNMLSGYEEPYEALSMRKDGTVFPTEFQVKMFDYKGRRVRITAARDITRRKEIEDTLRKQLKFIKFVNKLSVEFINVDYKEIDNYINDLLKVTAEFIEVNKLTIYLNSEDSNTLLLKYRWFEPNAGNNESFIEQCETGRFYKLIKKLNFNDDDIIAISSERLKEYVEDEKMLEFVSRVKNRNFVLTKIIIHGKLKGIMVLSYDNDNFKLEGEIKDSIGLCRLIITNILDKKQTEEALVRAKEKAEESDKLKTAFLSNMSHEIRTPMNGILGFINLLKNKDISHTEREEFMAIIEKSSKRLLNTINDLIDISKIEAGQVNIMKTKVNVNNILDELYKFFYPEASMKGINLVSVPTLTNKNAFIITDGDKLHGILANLIKNAIKFTDSGRVIFGYKPDKKGYLEFFVKDTGKGIPAGRLEGIFNRFEQADFDSNRGYEGSGLGLAIAKAYVEFLGGTIAVSSQEGKGSNFTFKIPFTKVPEESKQTAVELFKNKTNGEKSTFLVAEDEDVSFVFMKILLKDMAKKIIRAHNGAEAVELYRRHKDETDIILMDMKMPVMDGYEATRQIRKIDKEIPIIAQTAYALVGDREKVMEAGCTDYITKPIDRDKLIKMLKKYR